MQKWEYVTVSKIYENNPAKAEVRPFNVAYYSSLGDRAHEFQTGLWLPAAVYVIFPKRGEKWILKF